MNVGLIVAAGQSCRFGVGNKQFAPAAGEPMLSYALQAFSAAQSVDALVLAIREDDRDYCRDNVVKPLNLVKPLKLVAGGDTRQMSVFAGLQACCAQTELVWIHDGARPLVTPTQIDEMAARRGDFDGLVLAAPVVDTVKEVEGCIIERTLPRDRIWLAQTPQLFGYQIIKRAYEVAARENYSATDDAALVEIAGGRVAVFPNDQINLKVTTAADLAIAERELKKRRESSDKS